MAKSLLFIPDISGYTKFIQTTEVEHSQHVISELLEVLVSANTENLKLAEIEGDALFFYKEDEIPSQERLLAQIEAMFTAFHSHLELLKKNRICPCNACATAPNLELKIIAHSGDLQHIEVQGNRKPFGQQVIEAHRLLKNSVQSDNYVLVSRSLALEIQLSYTYSSKLFRFRQGSDTYDEKSLEYIYSVIEPGNLTLNPFESPKKVSFKREANLNVFQEFPISAEGLLEYITNYVYRDKWVKGVDKFEFNKNEVTRHGSEHVCVINGKNFDFVTVTKNVNGNQIVYGEMTESPPFIDKLYQFYTITPINEKRCKLLTEVYWEAKSPLKKLMITLFVKRVFKKNTNDAIINLSRFIEEIENV
ncbi:DUF2652 domain-containing protein [Croceitalea rosinachiae]|uniref:DUF2652 domain-containing protein n=1 Tax=Croceitalea rosinachiae TaxID=3075596 RepID=A0ABU3ABN3_9FLAO|nr:DUF2652 domain-containing protein [Croceitalea sp. F388]MDT0607572.1 DUF2652 domain-containing protein [Croceitalea sp. F388]